MSEEYAALREFYQLQDDEINKQKMLLIEACTLICNLALRGNSFDKDLDQAVQWLEKYNESQSTKNM